jgi:hypothetical protein
VVIAGRRIWPHAWGRGTSRGDWVRRGEPVAKSREEVDEVGLLLGAELEIADLAVRRGRSGRLGRRHSRDVLHVVEDLRRRQEPGEASRGAVTEVESYLLAAGVHGDVPLIVEMDDLLETFEDAIVHVSLHETWGRSCVHIARTWRLEESTELEDVARNVVEEPGPIGRRIGVATQGAKIGKAKLIANPTRASSKRIFIVSFRGLRLTKWDRLSGAPAICFCSIFHFRTPAPLLASICIMVSRSG